MVAKGKQPKRAKFSDGSQSFKTSKKQTALALFFKRENMAETKATTCSNSSSAGSLVPGDVSVEESTDSDHACVSSILGDQLSQHTELKTPDEKFLAPSRKSLACLVCGRYRVEFVSHPQRREERKQRYAS